MGVVGAHSACCPVNRGLERVLGRDIQPLQSLHDGVASKKREVDVEGNARSGSGGRRNLFD